MNGAPDHGQDDARAAAARRRRLAEVFGDVLPEQTSDDRDAGDQASRERRDDTWLREQVPPHHGA